MNVVDFVGTTEHGNGFDARRLDFRQNAIAVQ